MFNAAIFHALHDPANIMGAVIGMVLGLALAYAYKDKFSSLLGV